MIDNETLKLLAKKITLAIVGRGDVVEIHKTTHNFEGQEYLTHYEADRFEMMILDELQCLAERKGEQ